MEAPEQKGATDERVYETEYCLTVVWPITTVWMLEALMVDFLVTKQQQSKLIRQSTAVVFLQVPPHMCLVGDETFDTSVK